MSYNTRRNTTGFSSTPPQQNAASVGQRRPVVTNNFVSGGQLAGNQQQQKPVQAQQQPRTPQQQQQQQQQAGINFRSQTTQQVPQQTYQTQSYSTQQAAAQPPPLQRYQQAQPVKVEPRVQPPTPTPVKTLPVQSAPVPIVPGANPPPPDSNGENMETNPDGTKKKLWFKNRGKISKAEKVRRRNLRLSKILQPKNAVMILNELVKGCTYVCDDLPCKIDTNSFRASVNFEGQEFAGVGRNKTLAKNAAAETALKYLIKNKQLKVKKEEEDEGDEKMEIGGEEEGTHVMPWSHIASFAMYKLFSTWGEDPSASNKVQELMGTAPKAVPTSPVPRPELKPAKKMPDGPERMNPLMLMNQMLPGAQWEEVGKSGTHPNVVFTYSVSVDGKKYSGTGTNKKAARKLAAFAACHEVLKIQYPADVWVPLF